MPEVPFAQLTDFHAGIDGCAAGWFAVAQHKEHFAFAVFDSLSKLLRHTQGARRMLIDMPIGLPDKAPRRCDAAARRLLPPGRRSGVFPVPARDAVYAVDYRQACDRNSVCLGRKLSRQSWNICPKIRELDVSLQAQPDLSQTLLESHPELCFAALGSERIVRHSKKTPAGRQARLALLTQCWSRATEIYEAALAVYPRRQLARDDILDALVLTLAAARPLQGVIAPAEYDATGLPMQIVYPP